MVYFIDFSVYPYEDAAILMRYSKNLAEGHGIVWNVGESPVDGATDFLPMIIIALLFKLGLSLEVATRLLSFLSHIILVLFIYFICKKLYNNVLIAFISSLYLSIGPGLYYVVAYFTTPIFVLFVGISWYFANRLIIQDNQFNTYMFAIVSLLMGLTRPEGVILSVLMLFSVVYIKGINNSRKIIRIYFIIFILIGSIYFFWRWYYFGYPLPNPFYKKSDGYLHKWSFIHAIINFIKLSFPFLLMFICNFYSIKNIKKMVFSFIPIIGFIVSWILISDEMNYLMRFQYAILPIILLSWAPFAIQIINEWKKSNANKLYNKIIIFLIVSSFIFLILIYQLLLYYDTNSASNDGRYKVAVILSQYNHKNYTLATSEAGLLPLYSGWRTIDTWGLNDQWIAHNREINYDYIEKQKPDIIMFHAYFSPLKSSKSQDSWSVMTNVLLDYAQKNNYILIASFGFSIYDTHYYYVRSDLLEATEITQKIRNINYTNQNYENLENINFALLTII